MAASREIAAADSLDVLTPLGSELVQITRRLVAARASAVDVMAELNDQLVRRVLELTGEQLAGAGSQRRCPTGGWRSRRKPGVSKR